MSPALERGIKKALRTAAQMVASGGLTALVNQLAGGLDTTAKLTVAAGWMFLVTFAQNTAETAGRIPVLLPSAAVIPVAAGLGAVLAPVAGTVEAVADAAGKVTGLVTDVAGDVVGKVTGHVNDEEGGT